MKISGIPNQSTNIYKKATQERKDRKEKERIFEEIMVETQIWQKTSIYIVKKLENFKKDR